MTSRMDLNYSLIASLFQVFTGFLHAALASLLAGISLSNPRSFILMNTSFLIPVSSRVVLLLVGPIELDGMPTSPYSQALAGSSLRLGRHGHSPHHACRDQHRWIYRVPAFLPAKGAPGGWHRPSV